jgi:hypothetical protein
MMFMKTSDKNSVLEGLTDRKLDTIQEEPWDSIYSSFKEAGVNIKANSM